MKQKHEEEKRPINAVCVLRRALRELSDHCVPASLDKPLTVDVSYYKTNGQYDKAQFGEIRIIDMIRSHWCLALWTRKGHGDTSFCPWEGAIVAYRSCCVKNKMNTEYEFRKEVERQGTLCNTMIIIDDNGLFKSPEIGMFRSSITSSFGDGSSFLSHVFRDGVDHRGHLLYKPPGVVDLIKTAITEALMSTSSINI